MPNVGYAALQVIPSMRGISDMLRQQLVAPAGDAGGRAGQAAGEGLRSKLKAGAAAAGIAAGAVLVSGIQDALAKDAITRTLQAQLGTSNKVAAAQGKIAGRLYSSGVSGSFQEAADAIKAVSQAGLAPPGGTQKQLQAIATKASDVANVFGQDLGGVTTAVSQLMRNGLAKNSTQAFDLITKGFQSGANKADDLLDTINEYGVQFKKAGLDGATAIGLLNQGLRAGARDGDLVADAIKEFSIRAVDGSKTTTQGFKALGLNADSMAAKFGKGGKSASAALDTTLDRLRGIKDPVKQSQAAVALFGTQAEDLGGALLALDPSKAASGLGKVGGAADRMGKTIRSGPSYELEVFKRRVQTGIVNLLGSRVVPAITTTARWLNDNLGPAARGTATAIGAIARVIGVVVNWFRQFGIWLVPAAIAVGGLTLALNAQAIATAAVTAVFSVYRAAILVGTAVTNGFAAAQALLNAVMNLNPITLIVIALVALGAALFIAWQKSDTFRNIVMAAWNGIKTAALTVWNTVLKPFFDWFGRTVTWLWNTIIRPYFALIVGYWKTVARVALWLWQTILAPAFRGIWTAAKILALILAVVVFGPIILGFKAIAAIARWLWTNALSPVFSAIVAGAKLWWAGVKVYFNVLKAGIRAVASIARWLWRNVFAPVFRGIVNLAKLWWAGVKVYFNYLKAGIRAVASVLRWLRDNVVRPVWNTIKSVISTVWNRHIKPAFNALKTGVKAVGTAFERAKDAIKKAWDKLKSIAKGPVNFIINTVYNRGIKKVWDKVVGAFGGKKLPTVKGLARGGILPGSSSFRQGDDQLVPMRRGEGVYVSEAMRDPYERARLHAVNRAAMRGQSLSQYQGFAKGGIIGQGFSLGGIFSGIGDVAGGAWNKVKAGASWLKDTFGDAVRSGVKAVINPLINVIPGDGGFTGVLKSGARMMVDMLIGAGDKGDALSGGGPGVARALKWAKSQAGKPYQWGGAGNPSWDCSGFLSGISKVIQGKNPKGRLWSTFAFSGSRAPKGWKYHKRSPFQIGVTNRGKGHTAGTLAGTNVESRGGDGVVVGSRARGYSSPMFGKNWYGFLPAIGGGTSGKSPAAAQATARQMLGEFGWSQRQWPSLKSLWQKESGWRYNARNPSSGAFGIPQALPASRMRSAGKDWRSNPATQIKWGMGYIKGRPDYGSPARAWSKWKSRSPHWYDNGGYLPEGLSMVYNGTRRPEPVLTTRQWNALANSRGTDQPGLGDLSVAVYVGDREITDIARAEVRRGNGELMTALGARAGR
ncbi:phage tail tape measure protein [Streptomyces sp. NPDC007063]|uniref:aggregation-promoting factor C-terminal-like domain-containing protein n=1 Tax=Streptomyces sp. NPDC007063 TaxID=3364772 RepID=UPI00369E8573